MDLLSWDTTGEPRGQASAGAADGLALVNGFDRLTPRQQQVLLLLYEDDLSEQDVGKSLGIAKGTVRTHRKRALKLLRLWITIGDGSGEE